MRVVAVLLLIALLLMGCEANKQSLHMQAKATTQVQPQSEPTELQQDNTQTVTPVPFRSQYIRTDGFFYYADTGYPHVIVIDSVEAGRNYFLNMVPHDFNDGEPTLSTGALKPLVGEEYTEDFFAENYLIYVVLEEPSGSISHSVKSVSLTVDNHLQIAIDRNVPEVGTDDMACWHVVLELPRKIGVIDTKSVEVFLDDILAYDGAPVIPEIERPVYNNPPDLTLLHPDGTDTLRPGSFSWKVSVDGQEQIICADAPHPLQCKDLLKPITLSGEYVKLEFSDFPFQPDSINVCCWQDTAWGLTDTPPEMLPVNGTTFDVKSGCYVYQITVTFSEYGTAEYYAYLKNYVSDIS